MSKTLPEVSKFFKSYNFNALDFALIKSSVRLCTQEKKKEQVQTVPGVMFNKTAFSPYILF